MNFFVWLNKLKVSKSWITPLLAVFLCTCDEADDVKEDVCIKDLTIRKVLPDRNPIYAPVLIIGNGFTNNTRVTFRDIEAEISVINDSTITTRAPANLGGTVGLIDLRIAEDGCSSSTDFFLTSGFEDPYRASPPDIFLPDPSKKVWISLKDSIEKYTYYYWTNIWGDKQALVFESLGVSADEFTGNENLREGFIRNPLSINYDTQSKVLEMKIFYEQTEFGDNLAGGFYKMSIQTRNGTRTSTFLFLQSSITGRQFMFVSPF